MYDLAQSTVMEEMFAFMKSTSTIQNNLYRLEEKEKSDGIVEEQINDGNQVVVKWTISNYKSGTKF